MPPDTQPGIPSRRGRRSGSSGSRKPARFLDLAGGAVICILAVVTPWMYGTTENWSVRVMNIGCFTVAGVFLLVRVMDGWQKASELDDDADERKLNLSKWLGILFCVLNLLTLLFCLTAWWNARATFSLKDQTFTYAESWNPNLPTTYDKDLTWQTLINLSAWFCFFWSARYWLRRGVDKLARHGREGIAAMNNKRFRLLLWVISLNGFALAVQSILQRLSGSGKLLWIRKSWWGSADSCFGPFSYRGNGAEYLNLLWPVALGFWWIATRHRRKMSPTRGGITDGPELILIPAFVVMAGGSVISLSRGGAIIAALILFAIMGYVAFQSSISTKQRLVFVALCSLVVGTSWFMGWDKIKHRLETTNKDKRLAGRVEIYANSKKIAEDLPVFGAGPGAFRSVYHLYRSDPNQIWHGFLHDDWLETRVTFGWVGFGLILAELLVLAAWILVPGRTPVSHIFTACTGIALCGALAHAKYDFPFQTYSIAFTFILLCAVATATSPSRAQ